ncbi:2-amino-4-oxopentanoate thiolase subunit OrtB [Candidatus Xianfuyuplasma coldseepsis]|uniref:PLP-dependent lyase/thiolase n=1 Tax=Candidatus Xianfuyuplasma coldseepsis TaxID=2782163 RepID=A0A7L7KR09_9MOLU|nr:2-amino-4-oxopentanoate thiolase subunit OrtB [Xianfuyuplasma coldseepsis]QMS85163.1 PLP-dependent lyase/thiolase [Xianfuyuplasma coldseepsis]
MNNTYDELMKRRNDIMKASVGIDYNDYEQEGIAFDYEAMMRDQGYDIATIQKIQQEHMVGNTPLVELKNITKYARKYAKPGYGARIFLKDEAANLSGSFKARRAALAIHQAKKLGYKGVIAATSGNYGAAVAALAAKEGLHCIIIQEAFDSKNMAQPEILEKARKCEAFGAEVIQCSVGPELFYMFLKLLDETGYFNASLYSPYGVNGIETLGVEIASEIKEQVGKYPEAVVVTNAGGGNLTGTARGLKKAGATSTKVIGASVNLYGLHMASDYDFNRKSFTTGHTGFGIPFATYPDRSDVPRSAARPLRYMDRYVMVNQGTVFFLTEALAQLEGMERGPAGNTSLAAAFCLAQEMKEDEIIVVQETEYTGAGKHILPQLSFAKKNGIEILFGDPTKEIPGTNIIFPKDGSFIRYQEIRLEDLHKTYLKRYKDQSLSELELQYLADELRLDITQIQTLLQ